MATEEHVPLVVLGDERDFDVQGTPQIAERGEWGLSPSSTSDECAEILSYAQEPIGLLKIARDGWDWELIAEATAAGASIRLSVLKGNPARHLYRLGFSVVEEGEHAMTMRFVPTTAGFSTG